MNHYGDGLVPIVDREVLGGVPLVTTRWHIHGTLGQSFHHPKCLFSIDGSVPARPFAMPRVDVRSELWIQLWFYVRDPGRCTTVSLLRRRSSLGVVATSCRRS